MDMMFYLWDWFMILVQVLAWVWVIGVLREL